MNLKNEEDREHLPAVTNDQMKKYKRILFKSLKSCFKMKSFNVNNLKIFEANLKNVEMLQFFFL